MKKTNFPVIVKDVKGYGSSEINNIKKNIDDDNLSFGVKHNHLDSQKDDSSFNFFQKSNQNSHRNDNNTKSKFGSISRIKNDKDQEDSENKTLGDVLKPKITSFNNERLQYNALKEKNMVYQENNNSFDPKLLPHKVLISTERKNEMSKKTTESRSKVISMENEIADVITFRALDKLNVNTDDKSLNTSAMMSNFCKNYSTKNSSYFLKTYTN